MRSDDNAFIVSVMASDRVGIVADVTAAIQKADGNLEDVTQTVMRGYFTMLMLVELPGGQAAADKLAAALRQRESLTGAVISVVPYRPPKGGSPHAGGDADSQYVLTASGPDRPGIVASFSNFLKSNKINIIDLSSCIKDGEYTMVWLVSIPPEIDVHALRERLTQELSPLALKIGLRHQDIFRRTNEI